MATVTIETAELTISKRVTVHGDCAQANVVKAIIDVVAAYDAAHGYKQYSVRQHLIEQLEKP
jgi:hypothetical protein